MIDKFLRVRVSEKHAAYINVTKVTHILVYENESVTIHFDGSHKLVLLGKFAASFLAGQGAPFKDWGGSSC